MSSRPNSTAISVRGLSKSYFLYDKSSDRFRQMMSNLMRRILFLKRKQFFTHVHALKPIDFDLESGRTVAIIGLNGAGKSTLLQLICGTLEPTQGHVERSGRIAALLELGAGFDPMLTGKENIVFAGLLLGMTRAEIAEKQDKITRFADIGDFIDYPVNTYSTGMFVRLAFSVAIHSDPEILIIDEALSVGDFMFQQKCNEYLKNNLRDTTKLLVTHDLGAVTNLADKVLVLNRGHLVYSGDTQTAIEKYQQVARSETTALPKTALSDVFDKPVAPTGPCNISSESWNSIDTSKLSGDSEAKITKFEVSVNDKTGYDVCETGDQVNIKFAIVSTTHMDKITIGYQIQDRFGNVIFGNNTLGSGFGTTELTEGETLFSFDFEWPLLASGEYGLTIGVGQGDHTLHHSVLCWAHNISVLHSAPKEDLHGIFNVAIQTLERVSK